MANPSETPDLVTDVVALYVDPRGPYPGIVADWYDEARDARTYAGPWPVVAHPPCSTWCQIAAVNEARYGHRIGDDAGCFESALVAVRTWGGVLEHPAETKSWGAFSLPRPRPGRWLGNAEIGWVAELSQRAYGHRARKLTWLYAFGFAGPPPSPSWERPEPVATVSFLTNHGGGDLPRLSKREAKATPPAFARWLVELARGLKRGEAK